MKLYPPKRKISDECYKRIQWGSCIDANVDPEINKAQIEIGNKRLTELKEGKVKGLSGGSGRG